MSDLELIGSTFIVFAICLVLLALIKYWRSKKDISLTLNKFLLVIEILLYVLFIIPAIGLLIMTALHYLINLL